MASFIIFYAIILVILGLILTEIPLKLVRVLVDSQSEKSEAIITIVENNVPMHLAVALKRFREKLEHDGNFVVWPKLLNFFTDWEVENTDDTAVFLPKTMWYHRRYNKDNNASYRRLLIFVHGGGMVAGSPLKHNSLHWITTIAWFGGEYNRYTDLLSLDYRLSPEHESPNALIDCLGQIRDVCLRIEGFGKVNLERVHLIGFSAGALLALQIALTLEYARKYPVASRIFEITVDRHLKSFADMMYDRISQFDLHLCSPVTRLDRLFLNRHTDVSSTLRLFTKIFTRRAEQHDPMYVMQKHRLCLDCANSVNLIDTSCNSLSNHSIQLAHYLTLIGHQGVSILIMDRQGFNIRPKLLHNIKMFYRQHHAKPHNFLQNLQKQGESSSQIPFHYGHDVHVNRLYYHLFPFIALSGGAWLTLESILGVGHGNTIVH